MTKDGRPSLLNDIRLFGKHEKLVEGWQEIVAFARRLAWYLNGEEISLGSFTALYINFRESLPAGDLQLRAKHPCDHSTWWFQEIFCGVPEDVSTRPDCDDVLRDCIVRAIVLIRPEKEQTIRDAAALVQTHAAAMRFPIRMHSTRRFGVLHSASIAAWKQPSQLFLTVVEHGTGKLFEAPPIDLVFYDQAFPVSRSIRLSEALMFFGAPEDAPRTDARGRDVYAFSPSSPMLYSKIVRAPSTPWP